MNCNLRRREASSKKLEIILEALNFKDIKWGKIE
jgi:hypothetical protein